MPAPEYKDELRKLRFPVDENTRPAAVLYTFDPSTNQFLPITSTAVPGITGGVLNTNIVGGVMQVENLHVEMVSTGIHGVTGGMINPSTEETLQDILEAIGSTAGAASAFGVLNVSEARINPSTEETLQDILETLGGAVVNPKQVGQSTYGEAEVDGSAVSMTGIVEFEVPAGKRFAATSLRGWADVDVEFSVTINGDQIDGFRTTPAQLTMNISAAQVHFAQPLELVKIWAKHAYAGKTRTVKAVIQGTLEIIP
jgi:hypothetical protein